MAVKSISLTNEITFFFGQLFANNILRNIKEHLKYFKMYVFKIEMVIFFFVFLTQLFCVLCLLFDFNHSF